MPKQEHYDLALSLFDRHHPIIITDIAKPDNRTLLENNLKRFGEYTRLNNIASPLALYKILSTHRNDLLFIDVDFVQLRKNYLNILERAICSSPDSGKLWTVEYLDKPTFEFKGKLILTTHFSKSTIKADKKYQYISRDCQFI